MMAAQVVAARGADLAMMVDPRSGSFLRFTLRDSNTHLL
jgi:hypothetical protein